jgi:uncharacterized protein (TIGR03546 family)
MLRTLAKLLQVLNSETAPGQITLGLALGMVMGFTPFFALHNVLVLLLVLVLRANLSAFFIGLAVFAALAFALDPVFHQVGLAVLRADALQETWTTFYNTALGRLSRFNNTVVMGSLIVSLVLFVPVLLSGNKLITHYRAHVPGWFKNSRIVTALKSSRFYEIYQSVSRVTPP